MEIPRYLESTETPFPDPNFALAEPDGLLAIGGELSSQRLIDAYRHGIFPWYGDDQPILWWSPSKRAILLIDDLKIPRSLHQALNKKNYTVTFDKAFADVIQQCAEIPRGDQDGTWITAEMINAYKQLHEDGIAHSVEVWRDEQLIGGLYGLCLGQAFFGESMFHLAPNGAKIALTYLARQLNQWGFDWIDCQVPNPFLSSLGVTTQSRCNFLTLLSNSLKKPTPPRPWQLDYRY